MLLHLLSHAFLFLLLLLLQQLLLFHLNFVLFLLLLAYVVVTLLYLHFSPFLLPFFVLLLIMILLLATLPILHIIPSTLFYIDRGNKIRPRGIACAPDLLEVIIMCYIINRTRQIFIDLDRSSCPVISEVTFVFSFINRTNQALQFFCMLYDVLKMV